MLMDDCHMQERNHALCPCWVDLLATRMDKESLFLFADIARFLHDVYLEHDERHAISEDELNRRMEEAIGARAFENFRIRGLGEIASRAMQQCGG